MVNSGEKPISGHISMLLATIMWGAMAPIAKGVLQSGLVNGLLLSAIRIGGGTVLFLLCALLPKRITGDCKVAKKDILTLFIASLLMISANQGLYILGIQYTSPVDTTVMCTLTPIFTMILAALFIGNPMTPLKISGVVIGLAGAIIMALSDMDTNIASNPLLGNTLCAFAQLCAAIYYVFFLKLITKYPPFTIMKWMFLFSAFTYVPCILMITEPVDLTGIDLQAVLSLLYIIIFPTFIAYLLIPYAQRRLKPTVVAAYAYLQPVVSAIISAIMGLALFGWNRIFATMMIFAGVYMVSASMTKKLHYKQKTEYEN